MNIPIVSLPRGMGERGSWKEKRVLGRPMTAEISCPDCGKRASLADHSIDGNGEVTPDVICPHGTCNWNAQVLLVGWTGPSPYSSTDSYPAA